MLRPAPSHTPDDANTGVDALKLYINNKAPHFPGLPTLGQKKKQLHHHHDYRASLRCRRACSASCTLASTPGLTARLANASGRRVAGLARDTADAADAALLAFNDCRRLRR